jgi:hypothetical protein
LIQQPGRSRVSSHAIDAGLYATGHRVVISISSLAMGLLHARASRTFVCWNRVRRSGACSAFDNNIISHAIDDQRASMALNDTSCGQVSAG